MHKIVLAFVIIAEKEPVQWRIKSAERGNTDAQLILGHCHYNEKGISKDEVKALHWLVKPAEGRNIDAQYFLGRFYRSEDRTSKVERKYLNHLREGILIRNIILVFVITMDMELMRRNFNDG